MKRILIIQNQPDSEIGGIESYNRKLTKIINKNFNNVIIDKVAIYHGNSELNKNCLKSTNYYFVQSKKYKENLNLFNWIISIFKSRKFIYKLCSKNKYDLIIDSTMITYKKLFLNNNYWWVQHQTPQYYSHDFYKGFKKILIKIGCLFLGVKNNLYFVKNLVLYDKDNYDYVIKKRDTFFNYELIPLCCAVPTDYLSTLNKECLFRKKIIYLGRIDDKQKNIKLLIELNKKLNLIDFYGSGSEVLIKELGNNYKGVILNNENKLKIISKYKYMILVSNYEGFSFSLVEALACGVPIVVRDTFISARYLADNNKNGLLIQNSLDFDEFLIQLKKIYNISDFEYSILCKNAYSFALHNLNDNIFESHWLNILNKYLI